MPHLLHVVDAFADRPFTGNPAAVCVMAGAADEGWMQKVAREMNLAETAFLHPIKGGYSLRWFTPEVEVKLCGHATLASAFALWETGALQPEEEARFQTLSGWLTCRRFDDWIEMNFPAVPTKPCEVPAGLAQALGADLLGAGSNGMDYLVEVDNETTLRALKPDFSALARLPVRGVIVTCAGNGNPYDFLSRFFGPAVGINEDPVTGSAHCALGPYWQARLGKSGFVAYQASARGGVVKLSVAEDRVLLRGQAVMISHITLLH